jgi:inorganic pyrophosphatase
MTTEPQYCMVEIPKDSRAKYETPKGTVVKAGGWFALDQALAEIDRAHRCSEYRAATQPCAPS